MATLAVTVPIPGGQVKIEASGNEQVVRALESRLLLAIQEEASKHRVEQLAGAPAPCRGCPDGAR